MMSTARNRTGRKGWQHLASAVALALSLMTAAACSDDDAGDGSVTISVSNLPPKTEKATRDAFLARVAEFEKANPDIDVKPNEYEWDPTTFAAQLAGRTLPTTVMFPFTDGKSLIERGQLADITSEVEALPYAGDFNPEVLQVVQDDDEKIYGVPVEAYGIGLSYNRALFEQAGLDPDKPPTTWDEVREYADTIAEKTGKAGYAQMSQNNTGGWMLTTLTYALGGRIQEGSGDDAEATIDNPETKRVLELLHDMRWEDDSMGKNLLFEWGTINQAFAAGQVGMYMSGSDVYNSLVTENSIDSKTYGLTVLPLDGAESGVLGGGSIVGVRPDASAAEREAAVKWIDFFYMGKLTDEQAATADAEALAKTKAPVGTPKLPIFDAEQLAESDGWIAKFVNVPEAQMASFKDGILEQPLVPEPAVKAQETYAVLDAVVQKVLTDENADIDDLLSKANDDVDNLLGS